jgi:hypothetical protein
MTDRSIALPSGATALAISGGSTTVRTQAELDMAIATKVPVICIDNGPDGFVQIPEEHGASEIVLKPYAGVKFGGRSR